MRDYNLVLGEYDISEWRYKELKAFCRQYPEMKAKASALLGIQGSSRIQNYTDGKGNIQGTVLPSSKGSTSDPVARAVEKREMLLGNVALIDACAKAVCEGGFAKALILNICYGSPYDCLDREGMITSDRNAYFKARRQFFALLDVKKQEMEGKRE